MKNMPKPLYHVEDPSQPEELTSPPAPLRPRWVLALSASLVFSGVALFSWQVLFPWAGYTLNGAVLGQTERIVSPTVEGWDFEAALVPTPLLGGLDFSRLSTERRPDVPDEFYLTIEKLGIERARVITDLDARDEALYLPYLEDGIGHLLGSAYPGDWGNAFLFGHSASPLFYNPTDYTRIFSTLPTLELGDRIKVELGDKEYIYQVEEKRVVDPDADLANFRVSPGRKLTLMTCVPPGLKTKRLMVISRLVE